MRDLDISRDADSGCNAGTFSFSSEVGGDFHGFVARGITSSLVVKSGMFGGVKGGKGGKRGGAPIGATMGEAGSHPLH